MKTRISITVLFLLVMGINSFSQNANAPQSQTRGKVKKWWSTNGELLKPDQWRAHWIWREGDWKGRNQSLLARRAFNVEGDLKEAKLYISADTHYRLFVNNEFVNRGPARSAAHHQSYDILDVTSILKSGKNAMAIQIHHLGIDRSYYDPARPGLLVQLELDYGDKKEVVKTDETWKVTKDPAWDESTPQVNNLQHTYTERYDFRKEEKGWTTINFDDSRWGNAILAQPSAGWWPNKHEVSRPAGHSAPWTMLVPRDIPYLDETTERPQSIKQVGETPEYGFWLRQSEQLHILPLNKCRIEGSESFLNGTSPMLISNSLPSEVTSNSPIYSTFVLFDFGSLTTGYPHLSIEGEEGTVVDVYYAPYLLDDKIFISGLSYGTFDDRITLSGKIDTWDATQIKSIRYMGLVIRSAKQPVTLNELNITKSAYPFHQAGSISIPGEPVLEQLWTAGANTVKAVTTDAYTDNYRERRQYPQTSFYAARGNYAAFGDPYLQRRYLVQNAQEQVADGRISMFAPHLPNGDWVQGILDSDLFWVMGLHDYLLFSGDEVSVKELLPVAEKALSRIRQMENKLGLIDNPPANYWIDWANIDRSGANFILNTIYLIAQEYHAETLDWMNMKTGTDYRGRAQKLRMALRENFWDEKKQLYADALTNGKLSTIFSENTNSLALAAQIATTGQIPIISEKLLNNDKKQEMSVNVLFMYWYMEGLFSAGYGKEALAVIKNRYRPMLGSDHGTLWESWSLLADHSSGKCVPAAWCTIQGENGFPPYSLTQWITGIKPTKPGMKEFELSLINHGITEYTGTLPTPSGKLIVKRRDSAAYKILEVDIPPNTMVNLAIKSLVLTDNKIVWNGKASSIVPDKRNYIFLKEGKHKIEFR